MEPQLFGLRLMVSKRLASHKRTDYLLRDPLVAPRVQRTSNFAKSPRLVIVS